MADFYYKIERKSSCTIVYLMGDLVNDVKASFESLETLFETRDLIFDCDSLGKINSIGVRHWLMFLDRIAKAHEFRFRNCRESFMDTALMIPGFTRNRPVDSFFTAFCCTGCTNEKSLLIPVNHGKPNVPTDMTCEKCGNAMEVTEEFDDQLAYLAS